MYLQLMYDWPSSQAIHNYWNGLVDQNGELKWFVTLHQSSQFRQSSRLHQSSPLVWQSSDSRWPCSHQVLSFVQKLYRE